MRSGEGREGAPAVPYGGVGECEPFPLDSIGCESTWGGGRIGRNGTSAVPYDDYRYVN